jgi:hypothetical protein
MTAVLPYAGTSGHSGSDTSRERAERDDSDGTTSERQNKTMLMLNDAGSFGYTWKELADMLHLHHGQASGVLSTLHKAGRITRLNMRRDKCLVYVLPEYVDGRETSPYRQNKVVTISATPNAVDSHLQCDECGPLLTPNANVLAMLGAHIVARHEGQKVMVLLGHDR